MSKPARRYEAGVERALGLFDSTLQDWADYISFLSRLLKALQAHPEDATHVPAKVLVARRLAQCLNPRLPSGVHQKALEVYIFIFRLMGKSGLSKDLPLFLPGISHTLTFASLSIRPLYLTLMHEHVLKLPIPVLRPALKAVLLSLLPGIEDENSEDFDITLRVFDEVRQVFREENEEGLFWQNLFLASITSASRRTGVLTYFTRYLPRFGPLKDSKRRNDENEGKRAVVDDATNVVIQPEPGLLIRCFATGLMEDQVLVQRAFLDMLVTHLPLNALILREIVKPEDVDVLVKAAIGVVLRRDMSLNRRLWSWFAGPDADQRDMESAPASPEETRDKNEYIGTRHSELASSTYFVQHGLQPLVRTLTNMNSGQMKTAAQQARPFRIALSLMDRWDIGGPVVNAIFVPFFRGLQESQHHLGTTDSFDEVLRSATVFFDGIESRLIWSQIHGLLLTNDLDLINFIISHFNLQEEEMLVTHIPLICMTILHRLGQVLSEYGANDPAKVSGLEEEVLPNGSALSKGSSQVTALKMREDAYQTFAKLSTLLLELVDLIPDRALTGGSDDIRLPMHSIEAFGLVKSFYDDVEHVETTRQPPFSAKEAGAFLLYSSASVLLSALESPVVMNLALSFATISSKVASLAILGELKFADQIISLMRHRTDLSSPRQFTTVSALTSVIMATGTHSKASAAIPEEKLMEILSVLIADLWGYLSSTTFQYHVEAVNNLWSLQAVFSQHDVLESTLLSLMMNVDVENSGLSSSSVEKFATLWNHTQFTNTAIQPSTPVTPAPSNTPSYFASKQYSKDSIGFLARPLLVVLDSSNTLSVATEWLQSLQSLKPVFQIIFDDLANSRADVKTSFQLEASDDNFYQLLTLHRLREVISLQTKGQTAQFGSEMISTNNELMIKDKNPGSTSIVSLRESVLHFCLNILCQDQDSSTGLSSTEPPSASEGQQLDLMALEVLRILYERAALSPEPEITALIISKTVRSIPSGSNEMQLRLLDTIQVLVRSPVPPALLDCLLLGLSSLPAKPLDRWISLLCHIVPLYGKTIFQVVMKITDTFCKRLTTSFAALRAQYLQTLSTAEGDVEKTLVDLLGGLEYVLARMHVDLADAEAEMNLSKNPEQPPGLFGQFTAATASNEQNQMQKSFANDRLTVVLCFQDTVRICVEIWLWAASAQAENEESRASFTNMSSKMRARSRRMLEHVIEAEPQECIETIIEFWALAAKRGESRKVTLVLNLLQTLYNTRPKVVIPATFNAIYNRTLPGSLDQVQKSTLSTTLSAVELLAFLIDYNSALEDDLLEDIWTDSMSFLREILTNPMPHRQILLRLLEFIAVLCDKMGNTNFGQESKMRRELGDLCVRLFTAIFTIKPGSLEATGQDQVPVAGKRSTADTTFAPRLGVGNAITIICTVLPSLSHVLADSDRLVNVSTGISTNIIGPLIRSKNFPQNLTADSLSLLQAMAKASNANKIWKKDVTDAFNDSRFFQSQATLVESGWSPLIRILLLSDKTLLPELLSRLMAPTAAGLVFGVGASAARLDADKRTQATLKRMAVYLMSAETDSFTAVLPQVQAKTEDLLSATEKSSPSSTTRVELYMLIRAIVLTFSHIHLVPLWPLLDSELRDAFSEDHTEQYTPTIRLHAAKLLDLLLLLKPDEFQLHEWLFVTDTVDAVHPPDSWQPSALADTVKMQASSGTDAEGMLLGHPKSMTTTKKKKKKKKKKPWLCSTSSIQMEPEDIDGKLLQPFFQQLSIHAFEDVYNLEPPDISACREDLLADLFST